MLVYYKKNQRFVEFQEIYPKLNNDGKVTEIVGKALDGYEYVIVNVNTCKDLEKDLDDDTAFEVMQDILNYIVSFLANKAIAVDGWKIPNY